MKKYGVIYNYETPVKVGELEIKKVVRNPISYTIFTNEGVKRFNNEEDLTDEEILNLLTPLN
jgi:hypothetical protein